VRIGGCSVRVITNKPAASAVVLVLGGPATLKHANLPNQEECAAKVVVDKMKRTAKHHPEAPPLAQILWTESQCVFCGVLSQLPKREALKKQLQKERRRGETCRRAQGSSRSLEHYQMRSKKCCRRKSFSCSSPIRQKKRKTTKKTKEEPLQEEPLCSLQGRTLN